MVETRLTYSQTISAFLLLLCLLCSPLTFALETQKKSSGTTASVVHRPDTLLRTGHTGFIRVAAISPDGRLLASGGADKFVLLWKVETGENIGQFSGQKSQIVQLCFSPDGSRLASTSHDGLVRIYDVATRKLLHSTRGSTFEFSPDGKFWAIAVNGRNANGEIELHSGATDELVRTFATDWVSVTTFVITADGRLIGSGALEDEPQSPGSVRVWDLETGEMRKTWPVTADAFSGDGRCMGRIDYTSSPPRAIVSEVASGKERFSLPLKNEQAIYFSVDGKQIALTDPMSPQLKLVSAETGELRTLGPPAKPGEIGLATATFSPDGKTLAAAPYADHSIKFWDTSTGQEVKTLYGQAMVQGMTLRQSGTELLAGSPHGIDVWDLQSGTRVNIFQTGYVNAFATTGDSRWLATNPGVQFAGERLEIIDWNSKAIFKDFSFGSGTPVSGMAFVINDSPLKELGPLSRSFEFSADDGRHTVWSSPSPVASSPDGKLLAMQTGIGGNVAVWDMKNGNKLVTLDAHNLSVSEIVFSPDGRLLLTTGQDSQVRGVPSNWMAEFSVKLWDVSAWKTKLTVSFVRNGAPSAAFSPDGRKMAVQKAWDQVQVLDVDTGVVLESLQARDPNPNYHQFARANIIFSWDGKLLLQGAQDGVRVWKLREP